MTSIELTQKQLQERIDLENLQKSELDLMLKRHRLESLEAKGKYFEKQRQEQMHKLLDNHKKELDGLFDTHNKEWEQHQTIKTIVREAQQLSFDLQPKREHYIIQPEPEKETIMKKVKEFLHRKTRQQGRDM